MIKWSIIFLILITVISSILWFYSPKMKKFIEENGPLFSAIATLVGLTVFIQFYSENEKTRIENQEKRQEEKAKFNARMVALSSEIVNDILLCNLFNADKERHISGTEVPNVLLEYSVMSSMIINGDITSHRLRAELTSLKGQMESLNRLIELQQQLMIFKNFAPPERQEGLKQRTIASMTLLHKKVPLIRKQLADTQPLLEDFWNDPEKYSNEDYLKNRLLPEALVR